MQWAEVTRPSYPLHAGRLIGSRPGKAQILKMVSLGSWLKFCLWLNSKFFYKGGGPNGALPPAAHNQRYSISVVSATSPTPGKKELACMGSRETKAEGPPWWTTVFKSAFQCKGCGLSPGWEFRLSLHALIQSVTTKKIPRPATRPSEASR